MSTISSPREAYEALCRGEYFQVGTDIINPDDIVRVDYNDGQNPIFHLEDGTTVQHDRFTQGSVGDYLAAALTVATRGQGQSETIKPAANRYLEYDDNNGDILLYGTDGQIVQDYRDVITDTHADTAQVIGQNQGIVALADSVDLGDSTAVLLDKKGNQLATTTPNDGAVIRPSIVQDGSKRAVYSAADSAADVGRIVLLRPDGTTSTLVSNSGSASFGVSGINEPQSIGATFATSPGYAVLSVGSDLARIPLDGSTNTATTLVSNTDGACALYEGEVWFSKSGKIRKHTDVTNVNASVDTVADVPGFANGEGIHYVTSDRIHGLGFDENYTLNRNTGKVISREGDQPFGFVMATLDISLL